MCDGEYGVDMRQMYMNAPGIEKQKDGRERKGRKECLRLKDS